MVGAFAAVVRIVTYLPSLPSDIVLCTYLPPQSIVSHLTCTPDVARMLIPGQHP